MMLRPPQLRRCLPTLSRWMSSGRSSSSGGSRNIGPASINDLNLMNEFQTPKNDEIGDHGNPYQLSLIQRCGRRGFTAANFKFRGGLVLVSGGMFLWDVSRASDLKREHFALFELLDPLPELLVLGTGADMVPLKPELQNLFRQLGIQVEVMNSRKACATYNILVEEDRNVAAALIPIVPTSARELNSPETDEDPPSPIQ